MTDLRLHNQWTRSNQGWLAGVCQGLGERFEMNPGVLRILWLISILFFGAGLFLYLVCAFIMPVEGNEAKVFQPKIFGVCLRLAEKLSIDVVPLRILTVFAFIGSAGMVLFMYILLHFILTEEN